MFSVLHEADACNVFTDISNENISFVFSSGVRGNSCASYDNNTQNYQYVFMFLELQGRCPSLHPPSNTGISFKSEPWAPRDAINITRFLETGLCHAHAGGRCVPLADRKRTFQLSAQGVQPRHLGLAGSWPHTMCAHIASRHPQRSGASACPELCPPNLRRQASQGRLHKGRGRQCRVLSHLFGLYLSVRCAAMTAWI